MLTSRPATANDIQHGLADHHTQESAEGEGDAYTLPVGPARHLVLPIIIDADRDGYG